MKNRLNWYPRLKQALLILDLDNGCVNRIMNKGTKWDISKESEQNLETTEHFLSLLTGDDFEEFICGERSEVEEQFLQNSEGRVADELLNRLAEQL